MPICIFQQCSRFYQAERQGCPTLSGISLSKIWTCFRQCRISCKNGTGQAGIIGIGYGVLRFGEEQRTCLSCENKTRQTTTITVYGEEKLLQIGMTLEADILHEKRRLYEWVLEPIYSMSGRL